MKLTKTMAESGYPGFEADQWYGIVAHAGTPQGIVLKLNAQINQSLASNDLRARLSNEAAMPQPAPPKPSASTSCERLLAVSR
jgi:tripartite-type tricarboxylate transporter receptor subunit TctC